jgi:hypothetical protein
MTAWTTNRDILSRLQKRWDKGEFLVQRISGEAFEAIRISLKHPTSTELSDHFDQARTWIEHLTRHARKAGEKGYDLEWRDINHRSLGRNRIPVAAIFNTLNDILTLIGKTDDADRFAELYTTITTRFPELTDLVISKPHTVLDYADAWDRMLGILAYVRQNPRPMIYLRQLDIAGVDTKFIEQHKPWMARLLDRVLPPDSIDDSAKGNAGFEQRYGFLSKPVRIRFRILDPVHSILGLCDLKIPMSDFRHLPFKPATVFIVENDINGLAFPPFPNALVVLGLGYGLDALWDITWLNHTAIWYWGDIDTHGFAMLDRLRSHFPQTRSFLMDETTLLAHKNLWGSESIPTSRDLPNLTAAESNVYNALRTNRHTPALRLEQERIAFSCVQVVLGEIKKQTA